MKESKDSTSTWNAGQVKLFAKRIAESDEGRAWWAFPAVVRDAIVSHHVLMTVFSIHGAHPVLVDDIRELRILIEEQMATYHNLKVRP